MAPAYKLIYFDGRGAAELTRYLFKYGGIDFEDVRIKREDWPQHKDKTPFGQLPVLEHNGKQVGQSLSIARYVANLVKLAGKDTWENLEIDAVVDTINDLRLKLTPIYFEKDEAKKKTLVDTLNNETFPYYLGRLEKIAQKNNGYLALGRLTWADIVLATAAPMFDMMSGGDTLAKYPKLKGLKEKVEALPAIKKWIEVRPKTEF